MTDREKARAFVEWVTADGWGEEAIKARLRRYKAERENGRSFAEILGIA